MVRQLLGLVLVLSTVLVKGDRRVDYGRVVDAMLVLQQAGATKVGFLTEPLPAVERSPRQ